MNKQRSSREGLERLVFEHQLAELKLAYLKVLHCFPSDEVGQLGDLS